MSIHSLSPSNTEKIYLLPPLNEKKKQKKIQQKYHNFKKIKFKKLKWWKNIKTRVLYLQYFPIVWNTTFFLSIR